MSSSTATAVALDSLTKNPTDIAISILSKVPTKDLCRVQGLGGIVEKYEKSCLMDFLDSSYSFSNKKELEKVTNKIIELQDRFNISEDEAIDEVLTKEGII